MLRATVPCPNSNECTAQLCPLRWKKHNVSSLPNGESAVGLLDTCDRVRDIVSSWELFFMRLAEMAGVGGYPRRRLPCTEFAVGSHLNILVPIRVCELAVGRKNAHLRLSRAHITRWGAAGKAPDEICRHTWTAVRTNRLRA